MELIALLRSLQGERPGMSAGAGEALPTLLHHPLTIQTQVRIADVSYYQAEIDFRQMRQGLDGVMIRAGQRNWVDRRFSENWMKAREAGLPRGSYWLYDSREDPKKQAALWWSLLEGDPGELPHAADFEENYSGPYGLPSHFRTFLQEFQRLSGLPDDKILIYTGYFWWMQRIGNDSFFRRFGLWLAWYAAMSAVRVPAPWIETDLIFWQFTSSAPGALYGVSSLEIDLSWYSSDMAAFSKRFNLGASAPSGGTMTKYYKWTANAANIRTGPGSSYASKGFLIGGDVIQVDDAKVGSWFPFKIAQHSDGKVVTLTGGTPLDGLHGTYWVSDGYMTEVSSLPKPPTPETPPPTPTVTLTHTIRVYSDGSIQVDDGPRIP